MPRTRVEVERLWWLAGVLLLALMAAVDVVLGRQINGAFAGAAVLTAINAGVARTASVAGLALAASVASGVWHDNLGERAWAIRFATCVLICGLAVVAAAVTDGRRVRLERTVALAQRVLDALAGGLTWGPPGQGGGGGVVGAAGRPPGGAAAVGGPPRAQAGPR